MQTPVAAGSGAHATPPALRLRFAYDAYLSGAEALHAQRTSAREIAANVGRQEDVFAGRMAALRRDLRTLAESLAANDGLTAERDELTGKIGVLETISECARARRGDTIFRCKRICIRIINASGVICYT